MKIRRIDTKNKKILVSIPLTQPTGKIRIKQRISYTDFGIPVAARKQKFNKHMYVEWQISYDAENNGKKDKYSSLKDQGYFIGANKKKKVLYELSEYLFYFHKMKIISDKEIEEIKGFIKEISEENLIENLFKIQKTYPEQENINNFSFLKSEIRYPHLIHDFDNGFFVITEITIREKQKAIGIQPMLYICFPICCLKDEKGNSLIGRCAKEKEEAILELDEKIAFIVKDCFKIFGMLSKRHKHDTLEILNLILKLNSVKS